MRTGKALLVGILMLAIMASCGGGRDVDIHIRVGDQATAAAVTEAAASPAAPEATAAPLAPATTSPEPPQAAVPTAVPEQVQPTAPSAQAQVPTGAPPTESPAEPTAEPPVEPTTEPQAPPPPTEPPPLPTEVPPMVGDQYTFDPDAWEASLATLSSFRQKVALDFAAGGTGVQSRAVYDGEVTASPAALHSTLRIEGQAASQLPANQVEVIWIGDQAWVKVGRKPWVPVPVTAMESEYAGQVVGVGDLLPFVEQAGRVMPDETINGIPCKHYAYDLDNLQTEAGMTSAQGDIWVAKDGGYVVRLTMSGQGTYYGTYTSSGALNLVYDLYDVNAPITISPPR